MQLRDSPLLSQEFLTASVTGVGLKPAQWKRYVPASVVFEGDSCLLLQDDRLAYLELSVGAQDLEVRAANPETRWVLWEVKPSRVGLRYLTPQKSTRLSTFEFLVDTKAADQMLQSGHLRSADIDSAVSWLQEEFVCQGSGPAESMVFLAIYESSNQAELQLLGQRFTLNLREDDQGALWFERLARRRLNREQPFTLVTADVRVLNASAGAQPQNPELAAKLRAAATTPGGYLDLWRLYGQREWERSIRRAARIQAVSYTSADSISAEGGGWTLRGDPVSIQEFAARWDVETEGSELAELGEKPPDWAAERLQDEASPQRRSPPRGKIRLKNGAIVMETDDAAVPSSGYIYLSLAGQRTQHLRRVSARRSVEGGFGVPGLSALLLDLPLHRSRPSNLPPMTKDVRESFHKGNPTEKQVEALDIALNTPDVALIIGPPGTGKTQVIAALERRLSELNEGQIIAQEVLISSFQHDAVENALGRTRVYGLPPIRVGGRRNREAMDPIQIWTSEQAQKVDLVFQGLRAAQPEYESLSELQSHIRNLLMLGVAPERRREELERVTTLVGALETLGDIRAGFSWRNQWTKATRAARNLAGVPSLSAEKAKALRRQVRALRTQLPAFDDDGPQRASELYLKASQIPGLLEDSDLAILDEAELTTAPQPALMYELAGLQTRLLDRLFEERRSIAQRNRLPDEIRDLLKELQELLARAVEQSSLGPIAAVDRYREALSTQHGRLRRTVESYSSVVGATCQQAASRQMALLKGGDENVLAGLRFGSVVIDEAARANPLDLFIPMALAKRRIVLVGDPRQLPHLLDAEIEEEVRAERGDQLTSTTYQQSLFERLWRQFERRKEVDGIKRVVMLDKQFRMHPRLGDFVSRTFYESAGLGRVDSGRPAEDFIAEVPGFGTAVAAWIDVPATAGREDRQASSRVRLAEGKRVASLVQELVAWLPVNTSIGVITFYSAQRDVIYQELAAGAQALTERSPDGWRTREAFSLLPDGSERLRIGTVDSFQGKEFDVVVLSTVRCNAMPVDPLEDEADPTEQARFEQQASRRYGHLRSSNRLNVAMSRQRRLLIAVGDQSMFDSPVAEAAVPEMHAFLSLCKEDARHA
jgi:energy-coupling factor transporter ATP-binding protein EcfA2